MKKVLVVFLFIAFTGCAAVRHAYKSQNNSDGQKGVLAQAPEYFQWSQKTIVDAHGRQVIVLICEGLKKNLEAVVFSMNLYGDHTITGYHSLKDFGTGRISGSAMALNTLPAWAKSPFSSESSEVQENRKFRRFLIDRRILSANNTLTPAYDRVPASLLFYFSDMKQEVEATEVHENSHVFYNNLPSYKKAASRVFHSLTPKQKDCIQSFLSQKSLYAINDQDVLKDEFVAYYVEQSPRLKPCFEAMGADFNQDEKISPDEKYLWQTHHKLRN